MGPPVQDHLVAELVAVVGERDVSVLVEASNGQLGSALPQGRGDAPLFGIALPAVLDQGDDLDSPGERGQQTARLDRGELLGVTDQDQLGLGLAHLSGQRGHEPGPQHARFVDIPGRHLRPGGAGQSRAPPAGRGRSWRRCLSRPAVRGRRGRPG